MPGDAGAQELGIPAGVLRPEARPSALQQQTRLDFFNSERRKLVDNTIGLRNAELNKQASAAFLSGMNGQLFENEVTDLLTAPTTAQGEGEVFREIQERGHAISRGSFQAEQGFSVHRIVTRGENHRVPREVTTLELKGYVLRQLCAAILSDAFDGIRGIARLRGVDQREVVKEFAPFIQQVRDRVASGAQDYQKGILTLKDYPFNAIPESHGLSLDNQMKLADFWPDAQGKYQVLSTNTIQNTGPAA